jgi:hypothetical protein
MWKKFLIRKNNFLFALNLKIPLLAYTLTEPKKWVSTDRVTPNGACHTHFFPHPNTPELITFIVNQTYQSGCESVLNDIGGLVCYKQSKSIIM